MKLAFALWTCYAVQRLIEAEYDTVLPIRTVGLYLARWGDTPQRPARRAYEQCPKPVQRWLDEAPPQETPQQSLPTDHANIRGPAY